MQLETALNNSSWCWFVTGKFCWWQALLNIRLVPFLFVSTKQKCTAAGVLSFLTIHYSFLFSFYASVSIIFHKKFSVVLLPMKYLCIICPPLFIQESGCLTWPGSPTPGRISWHVPHHAFTYYCVIPWGTWGTCSDPQLTLTGQKIILIK